MVRIRRDINALVQPVLAARNRRNFPHFVRRHRRQGAVQKQSLVELQIALGISQAEQTDKKQYKYPLFHCNEVKLSTKLNL